MANNLDGADDASDGIHSIRAQLGGTFTTADPSTKERENSCTLYTHTIPPSALPPLYILIRVQKREEVTTLSIFWVSRKRLKMTFFFGGDYYYYFGERCVCVCGDIWLFYII
jgi:hypothetical protein